MPITDIVNTVGGIIDSSHSHLLFDRSSAPPHTRSSAQCAMEVFNDWWRVCCSLGVMWTLMGHPMASRVKTLNMMVTLPMTGQAFPAGGSCFPAIQMAIDTINARSDILDGYDLNVTWRDTKVITEMMVIMMMVIMMMMLMMIMMMVVVMMMMMMMMVVMVVVIMMMMMMMMMMVVIMMMMMIMVVVMVVMIMMMMMVFVVVVDIDSGGL
jgi:hypothetical protein